MARGGARDHVFVVDEDPVSLGDLGGVADVVGDHDGGVQRGEVERGDGHFVECGFWLEHEAALVAFLLVAPGSRFEGRNDHVVLGGFPVELGEDFDLLAALEQHVDGHAGDAGHFDEVEDVFELVDEPDGQERVLEAVSGDASAGVGRALLQVVNDGVVHVFLLLAEQLHAHVVQRVRGEVVVHHYHD